MKIILASASPRRSELLSRMGVKFEIVASKAEELHDEGMGAAQLCEINARRKAEDIANEFSEALVIGADTLVALEDRIFGKPRSLVEAKEMLRQLSGKTHEVVTGVSFVANKEERVSVFHDLTHVTFRNLTEERIEEYVGTVQVLDKAGAYGIQERGELIVERIKGSFSNVMGLPMERLSAEFARWGIAHRVIEHSAGDQFPRKR